MVNPSSNPSSNDSSTGLSDSTIRIIKEITPVVGQHAEEITTNFYARMFEGNPEVKQFFNFANQKSGRQPVALAQAVVAYFSNIDRLEVLGPAVELIAQKHCSLKILPKHYPIVGHHLLEAIKEIMGDAASEEIVAAVGEAYGFLADLCIDRERQIYLEQKEKEGGWNGYRQFRVDQKVTESDEITSFYLKPVDQGALPDFLPGQYLTVKFDFPETVSAPRNYSLSSRPGQDFFRISVKREPAPAAGVPVGQISNHLHDHVQQSDVIDVGPPYGEFTLDPQSTASNPATFLAAGIGITPLLSMIHALANANSARPITLVHACRSESVRPFEEELAKLEAAAPNLTCRVLYEDSDRGDARGRLTKNHLLTWANPASADFYCCGPPAFLSHVTLLMNDLGVETGRQHMEFFGPKKPLGT